MAKPHFITILTDDIDHKLDDEITIGLEQDITTNSALKYLFIVQQIKPMMDIILKSN